MKANYTINTTLLRILIYVILVILLVVTLIPVWMLIVNATRSTLQIQQGISMIPSTHIVENYKILLSKGLDLPRGTLNSLVLAGSITLVTIYFSFRVCDNFWKWRTSRRGAVRISR